MAQISIRNSLLNTARSCSCVASRHNQMLTAEDVHPSFSLTSQCFLSPWQKFLLILSDAAFCIFKCHLMFVCFLRLFSYSSCSPLYLSLPLCPQRCSCLVLYSYLIFTYDKVSCKAGGTLFLNPQPDTFFCNATRCWLCSNQFLSSSFIFIASAAEIAPPVPSTP